MGQYCMPTPRKGAEMRRVMRRNAAIFTNPEPGDGGISELTRLPSSHSSRSEPLPNIVITKVLRAGKQELDTAYFHGN